MKIDYATFAVTIEYLKDEAIKEGKEVKSVDDLVSYLDEKEDGFINFIQRS